MQCLQRMRILFVHQSFLCSVLPWVAGFARRGISYGIRIEPLTEPIPDGVTYRCYGSSQKYVDRYISAAETEASNPCRGCARAAHQLREQGFVPDLICAHPGWGEALFLRDVWPEAPLLSYQEFYYNARFDYDLIPNCGSIGVEACAKLRTKNANLFSCSRPAVGMSLQQLFSEAVSRTRS